MIFNIEISNNQNYFIKKYYDWTIYFIGFFWYLDELHQGFDACVKIYNLFLKNEFDFEEFEKKLSKLSGNFGIIFYSKRILIAMTDRIRSYPIYFKNSNEEITITNDVENIVSSGDNNELAESALLEFMMAGYSLGNKTIYLKIKQLQCGELLFFDSKIKNVRLIRYFRYSPKYKREISENESISALNIATMKTFKRLIETLNDRPVFIPLSGGLDSRLILSIMLELGYKNIKTYTYGIDGLWEIKRAKEISEHLRVDWHYIEFNPRKTKELFYTEDRKNYYRFASGYNSIPHLAEYYALLHLLKEKKIPKNAIIINGQSGDFISGGHIPQFIGNENKYYKKEDLLNSIINKHFSLWDDMLTQKNIASITVNICELLGIKDIDNITRYDFARIYEMHEYEERQVKYVINGQRAYEWLGFDWRLPLWSDELIKFWSAARLSDKINQKLYKMYLNEYNFKDVFNKKFSPQFSYYPKWVKAITFLFPLITKITGKNREEIFKKFFYYFMTYAPFYPQRSYLEYLKDSENHRNAISYWIKSFLKENSIV